MPNDLEEGKEVGQKPVLGKGLASLFPGLGTAAIPPTPPRDPGAPVVGANAPAGATAAGPAVPVQESAARDRQVGISIAAIDDIKVNAYQPRRDFDERTIEELAQSIRANGIIQPLVVRKDAAGGLELIAGERRLRAARAAGLRQVPVVVRRATTDREALELALIENIQRENLNCVDEALAYRQLIEEFSLTQEDVAQRVGKDRASVANMLRLLKLSEEILADLRSGALTPGHAKALLSLEQPSQRQAIRQKILDGKLSVRQTEEIIEQLKNLERAAAEPQTEKPDPSAPLTSRIAVLERDLTRKWGARVQIRGNEKRGKIVFHYTTRHELDRLLEAMHN